ncbi:hypothetical protein [Streptomyces polychromogenes]|uniref:hypothetical protein n=1 Tax=Streptomyces polychromogenes TaxID=67342 RepID=UPI0031D5CECA
MSQPITPQEQYDDQQHPYLWHHLEPGHRPGTRNTPRIWIGFGLREPPPHRPL